MIRPILLYPGGKWRFRMPILAKLARYQGWKQFREPLVGGGAISVGMSIAHPQRPVWINDFDTGVYCVWRALRDHPELLRQRVRDFVPSFEAFAQIRAYLRSSPTPACDHDIVHIGFCKIALHCLSYSGIGQCAGPRSHIGQRWSPHHLSATIARLRHYICHIKITAMDYNELIADESMAALLYLDPPYLIPGPGIYNHFFANYEAHVELARRLRHTPHQWVLSYDDCPQIRDLYQPWADVDYIPATYKTTRRVVLKHELLISSRRLKVGNCQGGADDHHPPAQ